MIDIFSCAVLAILVVFAFYSVLVISDVRKDIKKELEKMDILRDRFITEFYKREGETNGVQDSGIEYEQSHDTGAEQS